ncbi:hypothetical protein FE257_004161 [Aspergillus nanangensis]|uniref:DEUBAD domain-containing protein n=1 Tax=Aspergillus nanangensis TaxID=2582783 RepID=A0AAD4CRN1_ASPNN|nr:hypothetical protein FE257_004161 [Aspergillus nanangensis]
MSSSETKPKRNPRRLAKDRSDEHKLMTSDTSQLIDLDLVRLLARPEAWHCLEEAEKKELLALLPEDVHPNFPADDPNSTIPPLPEAFLRYSNNWRAGVRQFQTDLQLGRYEPEWVRQAEEAKAQRESGRFDKFKEDEFEQFWGQKQNFNKKLVAGQSSQVRLETLIEHSIVQEGDVWKYSRAFCQDKNKTLIEKEAKIVKIEGSKLTFVIPPGQRTFLHIVPTSTKQKSPIPTSVPEPEVFPLDMTKDKDEQETTEGETLGTCNVVGNEPANPYKSPPSKKRARTMEDDEHEDHSIQSKAEIENEIMPTKILAVEITEGHPTTSTETPRSTVEDDTAANAKVGDKCLEIQGTADGQLICSDESISKLPAPGHKYEEPQEIIIPDIQAPQTLSRKILEVDGRIHHAPIASAWKEYRCFRDNQDMGSLWEIRQAWYFKNN